MYLPRAWSKMYRRNTRAARSVWRSSRATDALDGCKCIIASIIELQYHSFTLLFWRTHAAVENPGPALLSDRTTQLTVHRHRTGGTRDA